MSLKTDKSEALGFATVLVHHNFGTQNNAKICKHVLELVISEVFTKVFDEDVGEALVVAIVPEPLLSRDELPNIAVQQAGHLINVITGHTNTYTFLS